MKPNNKQKAEELADRAAEMLAKIFLKQIELGKRSIKNIAKKNQDEKAKTKE